MDKKKSNGIEEKPTDKIKTEILLRSISFSIYQPDFARAILTEPEYSMAEAHQLLSAFFDRKE